MMFPFTATRCTPRTLPLRPWRIAASVFAGGLAVASSLMAEDSKAEKPAEKKEPPVIKVVAPLGIVDGMTVPMLFRGLRLGEITEVKFPDLKTAPIYKIKNKGNAPAIDKVAPDKIGDSQVEVELTLPVDTPPGPTSVILIGPNGQSEPRKLMILEPAKTFAEKEPNDGFGQAQPFELGKTIVGAITAGQNSDVFRFEAKAGQRIKIEIVAGQMGSLLDPFILLHNSDGQLLAEVDDSATGSDPAIELTLQTDGAHFLTILDAHDLASPVHSYLIRTQAP